MAQHMIIAAVVGCGAGFSAQALARQWGATAERVGFSKRLLMTAPFFAVPVWASAVVSGDPLVFWASNVLGWVLCSLALIDARTGYLPDALTIPLLFSGLAAVFVLSPAALEHHLWGAATGYLSFALLAVAYRRIRGYDGLGLGDAKLLAVGGAWCGLEALPSIALMGALAALLAAAAMAIARRRGLQGREAIRFGPYLAFAIWIVWLYGPLLP